MQQQHAEEVFSIENVTYGDITEVKTRHDREIEEEKENDYI